MRSSRIVWKSTLVFALLVPVMSMGQAFDSGAVAVPGSTGDYNTASNWSTGSVPSGGNPTFFGGRIAVLDSVASDVNAILLGASLVITNGASLTANNFFIGRTSTASPGHLVVYDGASLRYSGLAGDAVSLGWDHNVTATLDMYGGSLTSAGARQHLYMGQAGTNSHNTVNMLGGTMEFNQLLMGADVGSTGSDSTFNISGGILDLSTAIDIGLTSDATFRVDGSGTTAINGGLVLRTRSNGTLDFILDASGVTSIDITQGMDIADGLLRVDASAFPFAGRVTLVNYDADDMHFFNTNLIFGSGGAGYLDYGSKNLDLIITSASIQPSGYEVWAAGWEVDIGAETNDYDVDGLNNLYEFGLGGDPTNELDQGISPEFNIVDNGGTNEFLYIHPQLAESENSGLSYYLELNTGLVGGTWTNSGYTVTGTNVTGGTLDFVTNVTDTVDAQKFVQLVIEEVPWRNYYVSYSTGSDSNSGTSPESAWKTLTKASNTYGPGDRVYFKRGDSWSGERVLIRGDGEEGNPMVFGAYGSGDLPHFTNPTNQNYPFTVLGCSYLKIENLKITGGIQGIILNYSHDFDNKNITIQNCHIEGSRDVGIGLFSTIDISEKSYTILDSLVISGCTIENVGHAGIFNYLIQGEGTSDSFKGVEVRDCLFRGNLFGMNYTMMSDGIISNCTFTSNGGYYPYGSTAILLANTQNIAIEDCTIANTMRSNSVDGCGLDFEGNNHDIIMDGCEFLSNAGAGIMIFNNPSANSNITIKNSCFLRNNIDPDNAGNGLDYEIVFRAGGTSTGSIHDNDFIITHSDDAYGSSDGTTLDGFSFHSNNIIFD